MSAPLHLTLTCKRKERCENLIFFLAVFRNAWKRSFLSHLKTQVKRVETQKTSLKRQLGSQFA